MVERIIELSVRFKWVVFGAVLVLALWAAAGTVLAVRGFSWEARRQ